MVRKFKRLLHIQFERKPRVFHKLTRKVGAGAFGDIYQGINTKTSEEVAIKLESSKTRFPQLIYEANLYKAFAGKPGFPVIYWHGVEGDFNCMVMEMLGPCLEDLFKFCKRKFTIKTTCMLAENMINRIEAIHA